MLKILFVCLGNICRSPMAHFVFQQIVDEAELKMADEAGITHLFEIVSVYTMNTTAEVLFVMGKK